jgi:outer membrane protein assembly factor BamB
MKPMTRYTAIFITMLFLSACTEPDMEPAGPDWPRWRGIAEDGIYPAVQWRPEALPEKVKSGWTSSVGSGYSSTIIKDSYLYTTGTDQGLFTVFCLRIRDGSRVWSYSHQSPPAPMATPCIDGERLYAFSSDGVLFCLDAGTGRLLWKKLMADFNVPAPNYGFSGSPVTSNNLVILNAGTSGIAFDKTTGEEAWKSEPGKSAYATPVFYSLHGTKYAAFFAEKNLFGVELETGKIAWSFPWETGFDANAADPLVVDDRIFISSYSGRGSGFLDISAPTPRVIWEKDTFKSHLFSTIFFKGYFYGNNGNTYDDKGFLSCIDPATGEIKWAAKTGIGSLIVVGDKIVHLSMKGEIIIAAADPAQYRVLAQASLPPGQYWSAMSFCRGRLFIREFLRGNVHCIDLR